jgi:hypothetical protein
MTENRRRFASKVGHLRYFMGLSCKVKLPWRTLPVRPVTKNETASCAEGKGVAATVAPSSHILFVGN